MFKLLFNLFFHPDVTGGGDPPIETKEQTSDEIFDALSQDDEVEEIVPKEKKVKETEEVDEEEEESDEEESEEDETEVESDELKEIEKELDEPSDKDLESDERIPHRKEILKAYPDIFKKFPRLQTSLYRDQAYSRVFPTIQTAKEASEIQEVFNGLEEQVSQGNILTILTAAKKSEDGFNTLVDNYLPSLAKIDKEAYLVVVSNVIKEAIKSAGMHAKESEDEDLGKAVNAFYKYIFNKSKWEEPVKLAKDKPKNDDESTKLTKEREEFNQQRFNTAKRDLDSRLETALKKSIDKLIDPTERLTSYAKKNASRDAYDYLVGSMNSDSQLKSLLDKAWKSAAHENYSLDSMDRVRRILTTTARDYLANSVKRARVEALKGSGLRVKKNEEDQERPQNKGLDAAKKTGKSPSQKVSKDKIPDGMSTHDYLMSD